MKHDRFLISAIPIKLSGIFILAFFFFLKANGQNYQTNGKSVPMLKVVIIENGDTTIKEIPAGACMESMEECKKRKGKSGHYESKVVVIHKEEASSVPLDLDAELDLIDARSEGSGKKKEVKGIEFIEIESVNGKGMTHQIRIENGDTVVNEWTEAMHDMNSPGIQKRIITDDHIEISGVDGDQVIVFIEKARQGKKGKEVTVICCPMGEMEECLEKGKTRIVRIDEPSKKEIQNIKALKKPEFIITESELTDLSIAPNPNNGKFTVGFSTTENFQGGELMIFDLSGREIFKDKIQAGASSFSKEIDLSGQSKGAYILSINLGDRQLVKKIIIDNNSHD